MTERSRAEEDLRIVRSLMERATIYRAISAPTALVGGLLAVGTSATLWFLDRAPSAAAAPSDGREFAVLWLVILGLVLTVSALFVRQEARKGGRPFLSSGARLASRAIAPCLVNPAAATIWLFKDGDPIDREILVAIWIAFYGLALLSTALFAPPSLVVLGWAFLLSRLVAIFWLKPLGFDPRGMFPDLAMGATSGFYHLVYAAYIWSRPHAGPAESFASA